MHSSILFKQWDYHLKIWSQLKFSETEKKEVTLFHLLPVTQRCAKLLGIISSWILVSSSPECQRFVTFSSSVTSSFCLKHWGSFWSLRGSFTDPAQVLSCGWHLSSWFPCPCLSLAKPSFHVSMTHFTLLSHNIYFSCSRVQLCFILDCTSWMKLYFIAMLYHRYPKPWRFFLLSLYPKVFDILKF